jgi:hypothetical protein
LTGANTLKAALRADELASFGGQIGADTIDVRWASAAAGTTPAIIRSASVKRTGASNAINLVTP